MTQHCLQPRRAAMASLSRRQLRAPLNDSDQSTTDIEPYRCSNGGGFSLHANVYLRPRDRKGLLRLIRYGARQAFSQDRLSQLPDGRIRYQLSRPWGQRQAIVLEPTELLHRLAALIPERYLNLTRYHGCFSPSARRRAELINAAFRNKAKTTCCPKDDDLDENSIELMPQMPKGLPRCIPWAELLKKTFKLDVLKCPFVPMAGCRSLPSSPTLLLSPKS